MEFFLSRSSTWAPGSLLIVWEVVSKRQFRNSGLIFVHGRQRPKHDYQAGAIQKTRLRAGR